MQQLEELFHRALALPAEQRDRFVERECGDQPELRDKLQALLRAADDPDTLDGPALNDMLSEQEVELQEGPGSVIGRYKLLEVLGEGGFGIVYMAEQTAPVVRRVALKIIKLGMDSKEVVARFEAERQALALMDHPNIARVLDGGTTTTGRPYFVMELVRGVSITEFCDRNDFEPVERLRLFRDVCRAVQHAHQKGVIHRDLKPSNVLVTLHDGEAVPKVIDFGIAKAMHSRLTERTLFTRFQQFIGTPAYMSPEQAEMSGLDIDTRSDIYSLGVLLYELLTGTTPIDPTVLLQAGLSELQRVLREDAVQRPSIRVSTQGSAEVIAKRGGDRVALSRRLRGDLDWIVLKALEKDRQRRYESAGAFAEDIERHLDQRPVSASPPGTVYLLRKFVARNRVLVTTAAIVLVALLLGVIGTSLGLRAAADQRDLAQAKARSFEGLTEYLIGLLSLGDPRLAMRQDVTVRELLELSENQASEAFVGEPSAEARVRTAIGKAFLSLGEHRKAEASLRRAIDLFERMPEPDGFEHYSALWAQTNVAFKQESPDAFGWARQARRVGLDAIAVGEPELARRLHAFHDPIENAARGQDPEPYQRSVAMLPGLLDYAGVRLPAGDRRWSIVADTCMAAGYLTYYTPHERFGARFLSAALDIQQRELPPGSPVAAESLAVMCGMLMRTGQRALATDRLEQAVQQLRQVLAPDNFQRAAIESMLGASLVAEGRFPAAEALLLPAHEILAAGVPSEANFFLQESFARVVDLYQRWGRTEDAARVRRDLGSRLAIAPYRTPWLITRRAFGPDDEQLAGWLDRCCEALGGDAFAVARSPVAIVPELGAVLDDVAIYLEQADAKSLPAVLAARLLVALGPAVEDAKRALRLAEGCRSVLTPWRDAIGIEYAAACALCAELRAQAGEPTRAAELAMAALAVLEDAESTEHWFLSVQRTHVAQALLATGHRNEAEELLRRARNRIASQLGERHPETLVCDRLLAEVAGRK